MIQLVFLLAAAFLVARTVNVVVGDALALPPEATAIETARAATASEETFPISAFFERNLFKARRERRVEERAPKTARCERSAIDAVLLATLVSSDPEASVAMFSDQASVGGYRIGDVLEQAEIVVIDRRRVLVERAGRCESFELDERQQSAPPARSKFGETIRQTGGDEYEIARAEVDAILSDLTSVASTFRIVPSFIDGKPNGFKLFAIRPGSLPSKLGLQNGDIIQKVDGFELTDPQVALEIYRRLKDAQALSVDLVRRGTNTSVRYIIR